MAWNSGRPGGGLEGSPTMRSCRSWSWPCPIDAFRAGFLAGALGFGDRRAAFPAAPARHEQRDIVLGPVVADPGRPSPAVLPG